MKVLSKHSIFVSSLSALVIAVASIQSTASANTPGCNNEGDTCVYFYQVDDNTLWLTAESATGDYRNVRTWINGAYQGQFQTQSYWWSFTPPHNSIFQATVESCWNGFWSSTCHSWATAQENPTLTPPNARSFQNALLATSNNKCLDLPAESNGANGAQLQLWDCTGSTNQRWTMNDADGLIHSEAYPNKCLDLPSGNTANHTPIQINDCNGGWNQVWSYENEPPLVNLWVRISNPSRIREPIPASLCRRVRAILASEFEIGKLAVVAVGCGPCGTRVNWPNCPAISPLRGPQVHSPFQEMPPTDSREEPKMITRSTDTMGNV